MKTVPSVYTLLMRQSIYPRVHRYSWFQEIGSFSVHSFNETINLSLGTQVQLVSRKGSFRVESFNVHNISIPEILAEETIVRKHTVHNTFFSAAMHTDIFFSGIKLVYIRILTTA